MLNLTVSAGAVFTAGIFTGIILSIIGIVVASIIVTKKNK